MAIEASQSPSPDDRNNFGFLMQMTGEHVSQPIKSVSAVRKQASGSKRMKNSRRRDHANILWKRVTASYDEDVRNFAKNPALVSPITRWAMFGHLTPTQAMAARRYADIMLEFRRYFLDGQSVITRSANLEPTRGVKDQEIERRILNGTIADYEADARHAKRQYKRLQKVLDRYKDHVTGRNFARDYLDMLCCQEAEPPSQHRPDVALVLTAIGKEFGIGEKR
jgi:hypothetical protein